MSVLKKNIKLGLGLIIALVGFPQISETIYTPALPAVAKGLSASVHAVEATLAIYFVGFAVGVFLWGTVSDYIGRRKTMLIGLVIYIISCLFLAASQSVEAVLFWRFIQALGASVGSVITQTMLRDLYEGKERSQIFSVLSGALAFSPAIGPIMGGYISEFLGWRINFWALVIMGLVLLISSYIRLPETKPTHIERLSLSQVISLAKKMLTSTFLWGHVLLIGATNGILFSFYEEAPFVFIGQLGMRPSLYGFLGIIVACGTLVAARISYRLSGKVAPEVIIQGGSYLTVLGGLGFTLVQALGLFELNTQGMIFSLSSLFIAFVGIGFIIPNSLSMALRDYQDMVGTAGSIFGASYYCIVAIATWVMSLLHNGTAWPLPLYLTFLAAVLVLGGRMVNCHYKGEVRSGT